LPGFFIATFHVITSSSPVILKSFSGSIDQYKQQPSQPTPTQCHPEPVVWIGGPSSTTSNLTMIQEKGKNFFYQGRTNR
jgi:hypothetical protein